MNRIEAAAEVAEQNIGGFEPENAAELEQFLASLPDFFTRVAGAFHRVADLLAEQYPIEAPVVERLRDIGATIGGMSDFSGEAHAAHRVAHAQELQRIENPRPGERMWDVGRQ